MGNYSKEMVNLHVELVNLCLNMAQLHQRKAFEAEFHISLACFAASSVKKSLNFLA
jgi:hypothetical protein